MAETTVVGSGWALRAATCLAHLRGRLRCWSGPRLRAMVAPRPREVLADLAKFPDLVAMFGDWP
jgi:hypothetical protein